MQGPSDKYHFKWQFLRNGIVLVFVLVSILSYGQSPAWADSVTELKYQIDPIIADTVPVAEPDTIYEEKYEGEYDEDSVREEYFLDKEFTDGFPDSLSIRRLPENIVKALKNDEDFWYADGIFQKRKEENESGLLSAPFMKPLIWLVIIAGFVTFLVIFLSNSNTRLFRKTSKINDEEINPVTSDIFSINYQAEINKAAAAGNYRFAVRLMFLRLLRELSDTGKIQYRQDGTNFDYMMQLHGTNLYGDFSRLTRHYEYSWYGQFAIDTEKYGHIANDFENFRQRLNK